MNNNLIHIIQSRLINKTIENIDITIPEFELAKTQLQKIYKERLEDYPNLKKDVFKQYSLIRNGYLKVTDIDKSIVLSDGILFREMFIMDIYALARIMHKYSLNPEIARNIIVYTGSHHTDYYSDFFQNIGMEVVYDKIGIANNSVVPLEYNKLKEIFKCSEADIIG